MRQGNFFNYEILAYMLKFLNYSYSWLVIETTDLILLKLIGQTFLQEFQQEYNEFCSFIGILGIFEIVKISEKIRSGVGLKSALKNLFKKICPTKW